MKKQYSKPELAVESFGFVQSIADPCYTDRNEGYANHWSKTTCAWVISNGVTQDTIFVEGNAACEDVQLSPDDPEHPLPDHPTICYNTPENSNFVFSS